MAGLGYLEGILVVSESIVMAVLALQFGFMAFILMKLDMKKSESDRLKRDIEIALASIKMPEINIDSIKDELLDVVEDLMANMRIPSIADHLGGVVAQFMQMKQMKMAQDMGLTAGPETEVSDDD
tara:strand:+ start:2336 stop:2710 length:375 start_codon:yes stop_codon:yes gene_type:complete